MKNFLDLSIEYINNNLDDVINDIKSNNYYMDKKISSLYDRPEILEAFFEGGNYDILNYSVSSAGYNFVLNNLYKIKKIIGSGQYKISVSSPSYIRNNVDLFIEAFNNGYFDSIYSFTGNTDVFDDYFKTNQDSLKKFFAANNCYIGSSKLYSYRLKQLLKMSKDIVLIYCSSLQELISSGSISLDEFKNSSYYKEIITHFDNKTIELLYGKNVAMFTNKYGNGFLSVDCLDYIRTLDVESLNRFFAVFNSSKEVNMINVNNLYHMLLDLHFFNNSQNEILNSASFAFLRDDIVKNNGSISEYCVQLEQELINNLTLDSCKGLLQKYELSGFLRPNVNLTISNLINYWCNAYSSGDYKTFSVLSSCIHDLCLDAYNDKREKFIALKTDFSNGYPFKVKPSLKMCRLVNKRKAIQSMCVEVAYNKNSLDELKKHLVSKGIINSGFDSNILFALLTDGPKSIKNCELENININLLMGKILSYVSNLIPNDDIENKLNEEEYKGLPLTNECLNVEVNKDVIRNIVLSINLKPFFENVIKDDNVYYKFEKLMVDYDLLYMIDAFTFCDVAYNGDVNYNFKGIVDLINVFDSLEIKNGQNLFHQFPNLLRMSYISNNPLKNYAHIFGSDVCNWLISDPGPNQSGIDTASKLDECVLVYKKMIVRNKSCLPPLTMNIDSLVVSNICYNKPNDLITGELLGSCMRAGGVADGLFKHVLNSEEGLMIKFCDKKGNLISRVVGTVKGNTIFLNELRDCEQYKVNPTYLVDVCRQYVISLIEKMKNSGQVIDQVFLVGGLQASRDVVDNLVEDDVFYDFSKVDSSIKMDYYKNGIALYMDKEKAVKNNYGSLIVPFKFDDKHTYDVVRSEALTGVFALERINVLRALKCYDGRTESLSNFKPVTIVDEAICGNEWYVYKVNGEVFCDILDNVVDKRALSEYQSVLNSFGFAKKL